MAENLRNPHTIEILRASEERLRWALEAALMGIWDWNLTTNKIIWSEGHEQLFGLAPGKFDGTYETFNACVLPEDRVALTEIINIARQEKRHTLTNLESFGRMAAYTGLKAEADFSTMKLAQYGC